MKSIAIGVAIGLAFWAGVVYELERRPPRVVYIQKMDPLPASNNINCKVALKQCLKQYAKK